MDKTEELLAVLDLPKEEQEKWVAAHLGYNITFGGLAHESLADLAFRLRDEVENIPYKYGKDFETVAIA